MDRPDQPLQLLVRGEHDRGGGDLVDVAHLEADDPVLDVVDDADPVAAADLGRSFEQLDQAEALAVERDRQPGLEADLTVSGSSGASSGRVTSWKTSSSGACVEVLDPAPLRGAAPEVVVDRVGSDLGAALDRDPVLAGVGDLLLAAHLPVAHRGDHLQLRSQRRDGGLDPDLVVALAGAAVGDRVAARLARAYSTASLAISGRPSAVKSG